MKTNSSNQQFHIAKFIFLTPKKQKRNKPKKNRLKVNKPLISYMSMLTNKPQIKSKFFPNFNMLLEYKYVC